MARTQPSIRSGAPGLGEHSAEILAEAGYDQATIARLLQEGVIATAPSQA